MTLSEQEIEKLFRFCEKKYVRYYDLQLELVDHLAARIEEEIEKDPKLSFDGALEKVYKGFGIFGFAHIVRDREKALFKSHNRLWWKAFRSYFTLPKLALTLCLLAAFYLLGSLLTPEVRSVTTFAIWLIAYAVQCIRLRKLRKVEAQKLLLTLSIPATASSGLFFFYHYFIILDMEIGPNWLFALLCTLAIILEGALIDFNKKIHDDAQRLYPEAFARV